MKEKRENIAAWDGDMKKMECGKELPWQSDPHSIIIFEVTCKLRQMPFFRALV
jgi:hypothetical protein